jgi:hypothetical protein
LHAHLMAVCIGLAHCKVLSTTGATPLRAAGPATLESTEGAHARLAVRTSPRLGRPDANCRCAGTTAADGRGGECHEHTAVHCRCEYSQYPGESLPVRRVPL